MLQQQSYALIDGKYQLVRPLGEGGTGTVYEGRHLGTGRRVAVKVVPPELLAKGPDAAERFCREAMATGAIESQHVAPVVDTGVDRSSSSAYLVMELLAGEDLQQALRRQRRFTSDLALRVAAQACTGLASAHAAGVLHRDVKPANLFLAKRDGEIVVKLLDFGIAKAQIDPIETLEANGAHSGVLMGSPLYLSPEQARGKRTIDARSDLFSLGVVLYEMLTGAPPHRDAESVADLLARICGEPARPVREAASWLSAAVASVVHRALAIDPAARFGTADEMLAALRELLPAGAALDAAAFHGPPQAAPRKASPSVIPPERTPPQGESPARPTLRPAPVKEAMQRRIFVPAAKRAAVLLWGEDGLNAIASNVDDETREAFFKTISADEMVACRHVERWCLATWEGPAKQNRAKMTEYVDRCFDFSHGVIRRAVLRLADPAGLVARLPGFWKEDYTSGQLTAELEPDRKSATMHILDHPYTESPHARAAMAESYRYAFAQTRAKDVKESHGLVKPGVMMFRLRWA